MNCPQNVDWKAYAIGELGEGEKRSAAAHLATCQECREELAGVQATLSTLTALRDEEMPRRIAFVSDKVFEPRWWQKLNPMFASATVLAAAIIVHGFVAQPSAAQVSPAIQAEIHKEVGQAVNTEMENINVTLDQQTKYFQQMYKTSMNLVTY
jgi:anti-sigma factor RsiW